MWKCTKVSLEVRGNRMSCLVVDAQSLGGKKRKDDRGMTK